MSDTKHTKERAGWEPFRKYMACPSCGNKSFNEDVDPNGREIVICDDCNYEDDFTGFCADLITAAPKLLEALKEIAKREGRYSRDHLTHANNTIENMAGIAEAAIAEAEPR